MNHRQWRAVGTISLSFATMAAASSLYLRPPAEPAQLVTATAAVTSSLTVPGERATFAFLTPSVGWAAASMAGEHRLWIYATGDGARSWRLIGAISDLADLSRVTTLEFFDTAHGLLVIEPDELVFLTDDGGRSWSAVSLPPGAAYVTFTGPNVGWAATGTAGSGPLKLFFTNDAGTYWQRLPSLPVAGYPVFRSLAEGWLAGPSGTHAVYTTNDAGQTWDAHRLPASPCSEGSSICPFPAGSLGSLELLPGTGAIATDASTGAAFVSFDFGADWRFVVPPPVSPDGYADDSFEDAVHWWAIGGSDLYKTADAGATWALVADSVAYDSIIPTILDDRDAWAVIQTDAAWRLAITGDGGLNWKGVTVPVPTQAGRD